MNAKLFSRWWIVLLISLLFVTSVRAAEVWTTKLDADISFYFSTPLGMVIAGTKKSLYAIDSETGEVFWRRESVRLDPTDVAPVPGTDLLLLNLDRGSRARIEASDLFSGAPIWRSEKLRGQIMQMAVDVEADLLAVVLARDAKGETGENLKRRPEVHVLQLSTGAVLWQQRLENEIEMMPERWQDEGTVSFTLDNYHPPLFLDHRLYLFYEGVTSLDARSGKSRERVKFRVNEEGLMLTEADPVIDEVNIYFSGQGRVRAVSRETGKEIWEAKDLGVTPEIILGRSVLFARTGGRFTRLKDGEAAERGPYGVSAIDIASGKILWRYKGADEGITNLAMPNATTLLIADGNDLLVIDALTGKRRSRVRHNLQQAAFVIINEKDEAVCGGQNEIAAFDVEEGKSLWRARHTPPGRGALKIIGAVAARAAALYFTYGGAATTVFRGVRLASAASSFRWSGLASRLALPDLTTLASSYARQNIPSSRFRAFGVASRVVRERSMPTVTVRRPSIDVQDRAIDLIDPARQLQRLSSLLLRRQKLATLRDNWMYFYTSLAEGGRGLAGVNVNNGRTERSIQIEELDGRFTTDENSQLLFTANDARLLAYDIR